MKYYLYKFGKGTEAIEYMAQQPDPSMAKDFITVVDESDLAEVQGKLSKAYSEMTTLVAKKTEVDIACHILNDRLIKSLDLLDDLYVIMGTALHNGHHDLIARTKEILVKNGRLTDAKGEKNG